MKNIKIKNQILFSLIIVMFLSIFILGGIIYNIAEKVISENYYNIQQDNLEVSNNILEMQVKDVIISVRNSLLDENLIGVLDTDKEANKFTSYELHKLNNFASGIVNTHNTVEGMYIISKNGRQMFYYKSVLSGGIKQYNKDEVLQVDWVLNTFEAKGREVFYPYDVMQNEDDPYFSMTKKLINPNNSRFMGYMVVCFSDDMFTKTFGEKRLKDSEDSILILDKDEVVFKDNKLSSEVIESFIVNKSESYIYSSYKNLLTGWTLYNIINVNSIKKEFSPIQQAIYTAIFILIFICFVISNALANRINVPLKELETAIEEVGQGGRRIDFDFDNTEIGLIGQKFQKMVNTNIELRENLLTKELNEKKAQLQLLYANINSHFLYNTLDSIYCLAIIQDNINIAEMVEALSDIFRFSLNKGENWIKVSDEIAFIKNYMYIQNIRYENRFALILDIDEELFDEKIIRFLIQPFVENAMYHGLEAKIGKGILKISMHTEANYINIEVFDDGIGIDDIKKLENGYGIKNVKERLKLYYGDDQNLDFESKINSGTRIYVKIPRGVI